MVSDSFRQTFVNSSVGTELTTASALNSYNDITRSYDMRRLSARGCNVLCLGTGRFCYAATGPLYGSDPMYRSMKSQSG